MLTGLHEGHQTFEAMGGQTGRQALGHCTQLERTRLKGKIVAPTGRWGFLRKASGGFKSRGWHTAAAGEVQCHPFLHITFLGTQPHPFI